LVADLLPLVARRAMVDVDIDDSSPAPTPVAGRGTTRQALRATLARVIGPRRFAFLGLRRPGGPSTLMLWYSGYGAAEFVARKQRDHRPVVFLVRDRPSTGILDPKRPWVRPTISVAPQLDDGIAAAETFLAEVDDWAGVAGTGGLLSSRLSLFAGALAPTVRHAATELEPQLLRAGVTEVAAANPSSLEEFAALLAAGRTDGVERTLVQHGDHLMPYDFWLVTETQNFDRLESSDPTVADDLRTNATALGTTSPRVEFSSHRWADLDTLGPPPANGPVVYVPTHFVGDTYVVGSGYFDDAWYHRWHLRLLDAMARHPNVMFVWKGLPQSDQSTDPIPELIAQRNVPNVEYRVDPFRRILPTAGGVVVDFPSTALYETVHARRPVLGLVFPKFTPVRASAAERFASVLRSCAHEAEALEHLDAFLGDDRTRWLVDPAVLTHT